MDLLPRWAQCDDFLQESDEILTGMARGSLSVYPAGGRFQRGVERQRAVPVVLEAVTLGAASRRIQLLRGLTAKNITLKIQ
jgi:hypothetical protein